MAYPGYFDNARRTGRGMPRRYIPRFVVAGHVRPAATK